MASVAAAPTVLTKYVDPLPTLPVAVPQGSVYPGAAYYELTMLQRPWQFHRDLAATATWGYWAANPSEPANPIGLGYLGPTIVAHRYQPVVVRYRNHLPTTHLLQSSVDATLWRTLPGAPPDPPGGRMPYEFPPGATVWNVTHLHGGVDPPQSDGNPGAWFTPQGSHGMLYATLDGARANEAIFAYPNTQQATTLWYHDHAMELTRLNNYCGLSGIYLLRDSYEDALKLPRGDFEVPLIVQDRTFNPDGSLHYPTGGVTPYHPRWAPEFFGDTPIVNGRAYPFLAVEPRRYRFRVLNGSNARFYRLWFTAGRLRLPFWLIGIEQGFRATPLLSTSIFLAPSERADLIIDFSRVPRGTKITLANDASAPFPAGGGGPNLPEIMQFQVTKPLSAPDSTTPAGALVLPPIRPLRPTPGIPSREFVLTETTGPEDNPIHLQINQRFFFEPIEDFPKAGTTEVWEYVNTTPDAHPMHVHLVKFQVYNRQNFHHKAYEEDYKQWISTGRNRANKPQLAQYLIGKPVPPAPAETGWKDTFKAHPQMVNRIIAMFDLARPIPGIPNTNTRLPANYIHHCHILEHEDNDMMRPWQVVA
jgi:spore coat protein A